MGELERLSLFFDINEIHKPYFRRLKRLMDLLAAAVGLLLLSLALPLVILGNLIGNRGSLFYGQLRVGKDGHIFKMWKFRTMTAAGVKSTDLPAWTEEDDPRVTPFGRLLRKSHLDELPQAVNLCYGELSLVGPRPEQPHYVDQLERVIPFYQLRHVVKPGLTGWAQVNNGYSSTEEGALRKLQYDFQYMRRQNIGFDLLVLWRTIRSISRFSGR